MTNANDDLGAVKSIGTNRTLPLEKDVARGGLVRDLVLIGSPAEGELLQPGLAAEQRKGSWVGCGDFPLQLIVECYVARCGRLAVEANVVVKDSVQRGIGLARSHARDPQLLAGACEVRETDLSGSRS